MMDQSYESRLIGLTTKAAGLPEMPWAHFIRAVASLREKYLRPEEIPLGEIVRAMEKK